MNDYCDIVVTNLSHEFIDGLLMIQPTHAWDKRGSIHTTWSKTTYEQFGYFEQDIESLSIKNVLRGFHGDTKTNKLCTVLFGKVIEVIIDIRKNSKTFLNKFVITLDDKEKKQMFIPAGCVHAYLVLSDHALYHYKISELDEGVDSQLSIKYNDPTFNVHWNLLSNNDQLIPILSERDKNALTFEEVIKKL